MNEQGHPGLAKINLYLFLIHVLYQLKILRVGNGFRINIKSSTELQAPLLRP